MNSKLYQKRLEEGKILVENYKNSRYLLGKYCFEVLKEFKIPIQKLADDLGIKLGSLKPIIAYYRKARKAFGEKTQERHFLLVQKLVHSHKIKLKDMNSTNLVKLSEKLKDNKIPKGFSNIKKFRSYTNQIINFLLDNKNINLEELEEIKQLNNRLSEVLKGNIVRVA